MEKSRFLTSCYTSLREDRMIKILSSFRCSIFVVERNYKLMEVNGTCYIYKQSLIFRRSSFLSYYFEIFK